MGVAHLLMMGIAAAMSKVVLDRLARDQAQSFRRDHLLPGQAIVDR